MQVYYFGRWSPAPADAGHHLYTAQGHSAWELVPPELGERQLDSISLCPGGPGAGLGKTFVPEKDQVQGKSWLYHVLTSQGPWTVWAIWDRSADTRYGSLSSFVLPGTRSESKVRQVVETTFPTIWARIQSLESHPGMNRH